MDVADKTLRVHRIAITGLFGLYNHEILLNQNARVTILHGPNGVGKSVLLRLVAGFFGGRFTEFVLTPFSQFTIQLNDGTHVSVLGPGETPMRANKFLEFEIHRPNIEHLRYKLPVVPSYDRIAHQIERDSPFLARISDSQYQDYRISQTLSSEEVVERHGTAADLASAMNVLIDEEPAPAKLLRAQIPVQLVETQRLLRSPAEAYVRPDSRFERKPMIATVRTYSDDIVRQIARTLSRYGTESQKLDQTFPQRLIRSSSVSSLGPDELKEHLSKLDERQTKLNALGLIDKVSYPASAGQIDALDEVKRSVMALYVEDTDKKLEFLSELATRIRLLLDSVNGKFRNKRLTVSRERGLQVSDERGQVVGLESLSSGEQHELVLWFDLLFKISTNALVLIDEPELSLHVSWQKKFLPELLETAQTIPFDALIATHSPFIIGDRLDLTVPLDADIDE